MSMPWQPGELSACGWYCLLEASSESMLGDKKNAASKGLAAPEEQGGE